MAVGAVTKYNGMESVLFSTASRQWDDATAGSLMFCLADATYTPSLTHSTTSDVGAALITAGDGVAIAATGATIDSTTTPGLTYYDTDDADWGLAVTITAKYLIAVQPVTAGTFSSTTSKLLFYVDLNTASGAATLSSDPDFKILPPLMGWFSTSQA